MHCIIFNCSTSCAHNILCHLFWANQEMAKNIDTVVFSCVIEVKGTSVMDEKLILKIIDSLINNRWLVINATHDLLLYIFADISYHTGLISLLPGQRCRKSDWLDSFQCKTLQNFLHPGNILRFLSHFPPPAPLRPSRPGPCCACWSVML